MKLSSNLIWYIVLVLAGIAGYATMDRKVINLEDKLGTASQLHTELAATVETLQSQLKIVSHPAYHDIQQALEDTDKISAAVADNTISINELRTSGDFAFVSITNEGLDPATAYLKKVAGKWIVLTLGTGGEGNLS